jgi:hypothetical protein
MPPQLRTSIRRDRNIGLCRSQRNCEVDYRTINDLGAPGFLRLRDLDNLETDPGL